MPGPVGVGEELGLPEGDPDGLPEGLPEGDGVWPEAGTTKVAPRSTERSTPRTRRAGPLEAALPPFVSSLPPPTFNPHLQDYVTYVACLAEREFLSLFDPGKYLRRSSLGHGRRHLIKRRRRGQSCPRNTRGPASPVLSFGLSVARMMTIFGGEKLVGSYWLLRSESGLEGECLQLLLDV